MGHRLMAAGEYELALDAFRRAAARDGLTPEILTSIGTANLGLGRLNQAEKLMLRAVERDPGFAEAWNNLGVVQMERGKTAEARGSFERAFALDNGRNDEIRENLTLALAKSEDPGYDEAQNTNEFKLVRRGSGDYLLSPAP